MYQQLTKHRFMSFNQNNVDKKVFEVTFEGEHARDAGGPFREAITDICKEV